jgi:Lipocalin-like domain
MTPMATCRRNCNAPNDLCLQMEISRATPDEFAAAGSSYIAYSGRFFIDEDENTLSHEMAVSFFPNWFGQRQVRLAEINSERQRM